MVKILRKKFSKTILNENLFLFNNKSMLILFELGLMHMGKMQRKKCNFQQTKPIVWNNLDRKKKHLNFNNILREIATSRLINNKVSSFYLD